MICKHDAYVSHIRVRLDIVAEGGIAMLADLVFDKPHDHTSNEVKANAAGALFNLVSDNYAYSLAIAKVGVIPKLVELARDGTEKQKEYAAGALWQTSKLTTPTIRPGAASRRAWWR